MLWNSHGNKVPVSELHFEPNGATQERVACDGAGYLTVR